jgi:hypothetical protein
MQLAQNGWRCRRACQGGVAAARGFCPTWRSKGAASAGTAGGGRKGSTTRGAGQRGAEPQDGAQGRAQAAACSRGETGEEEREVEEED